MNWDAEIVEDWKKLGFYYNKDDYNKQWWLIGSKAGLMNFAEIIGKYIVDFQNNASSDHIHLGWYQYLKIYFWDVHL